MEIVNRISRMAAITAKTLVTDVKIGLVPTSGALGPGHLDLIQTARKMADLAVVSIFVNRLEFSTEEEYRRYPRDITSDMDLLRRENVDFVFIPPEEEMYPPGFSSFVEIHNVGNSMPELPKALFSGLATGALKTLHLTKPAYTFYGEQDAVQAAILRKMVRDLNISTEVVITPGAREESGIAYSGRNRLLTEPESTAALILSKSLNAAKNAVASGETNAKKVLTEMTRVVWTEQLAALEYAVIMDPNMLEPVTKIDRTVIIGVGAKIGNVSLTDAYLVEKP